MYSSFVLLLKWRFVVGFLDVLGQGSLQIVIRTRLMCLHSK